MSTPQCSFIIYLHHDEQALGSLVQDFRAFFQKFPIPYEILAVVEFNDKNTVKQLEELKKNSPPQESLHWHLNSHFMGRARSLWSQLDKTQADLILFPSVSMATPLGDLFKILQTLASENTLQICWGDRYEKKNSLLQQAATPALKWENIFNKILKEKKSWFEEDLLCEVGGLRKTAAVELQKHCLVKKIQGWYLHPYLLHAQKLTTLKSQTTSVHDSGIRPSSYSLKKNILNLLRQSLF